MDSPRSTRVSSRVLVITLCAALCTIGMALILSIRAEQAARTQVERTVLVMDLLNEAMTASLDAETGQRGYLLTGDPAYLAPYQAGRAAWLPAIDRLDKALAEGDPALHADAIAALRSFAEAKLELLQTTIDMADAGQRDGAIAVVLSDRGKLVMDQYRATLKDLDEAEQTVLATSMAEARAVEARTLPILVFLGILIVCLVILGFWLERRAAGAEASARDITALRASQQQSDLLSRELNHRVKNLFAVILAIVSLSGRGQTDVKTVVAAIRSRIHALSLAHAVSQGDLEVKIVRMRDVLAATLEPYDTKDGRITLTGPDVELPVKAVTPLGLVAHELATNAAKYGGLSGADGGVTITWSRTQGADGPVITLVWEERGGVGVVDEPQPGFGSVMMKSAAAQLDGTMTREWLPSGMRATLVFSEHQF